MKSIIYISVVDISIKNGQGIYALKTLEAFISNNNSELEVILPKPKNPENIQEVLENKGVKYHFLKTKTKDRSVSWHMIIQFQLFYTLVMLGKRDALVYSLKPMMIAPVLYSKIYNVDIYLLVEGLAKNTIKTITKAPFSRISSFLLNLNLKNAKVVYPAYKSAKEWVDDVRSVDESKVINCGVDLNIFVPARQKTTKKLTIGYVGSFRQVHLILELIQASKNLELELLLIGEGKEKTFLEIYIKDRKITNVYFTGSKEQKDVVNYFQMCDIMWAGTDINHWGVPIKCFEYLACNKKVIYTNKEDFNFIFENNYGYRLNATDVNSIREVLTQVLKDYENGVLKDNFDSRTYIVEHNDWNNFAKIIIEDINHDN